MISIPSRLCAILALVASVTMPAAGNAADAVKATGSEPATAIPVLANRQHFLYTDGQQLYGALCQACHQKEGAGAVGAAAYPALANNKTLEHPAYPIHMVLNGQNAMPGFKDILDDSQIAAVVTYIRTHFGNAYAAPVTTQDVSDLHQ